MSKSIISIDVFFKFNGLESRIEIIEHKDLIIFMTHALFNESKIECFRVCFGSKDFEYGSSVDELARYLKYKWFEEVETCEDVDEEADVSEKDVSDAGAD